MDWERKSIGIGMNDMLGVDAKVVQPPPRAISTLKSILGGGLGWNRPSATYGRPEASWPAFAKSIFK